MKQRMTLYVILVPFAMLVCDWIEAGSKLGGFLVTLVLMGIVETHFSLKRHQEKLEAQHGRSKV